MQDADREETPEEALAYQALLREARIGANLERQLRDPHSAISLVVEKARAEAVSALIALITVDPEDRREIRHFQNHAARYLDLYRWLEDTLYRSGEAEDLIDEADRQGLAEATGTEEIDT